MENIKLGGGDQGFHTYLHQMMGRQLNIRKKGSNAFLKTEKFIASNPGW